jgi:hypothetical protein
MKHFIAKPTIFLGRLNLLQCNDSFFEKVCLTA